MAEDRYTPDFMKRILDGDRGVQLKTDEEMAGLSKWQPQAREQNKGRFPQSESVQETPSPTEVPDDLRVGTGGGPSRVEKTDTPSLTPSWGGSPAAATPAKPASTTDEEPDLPVPSRSSRDKAPATPATVSRVIDGDTFVANIGGADRTVRISGIDAPELGPGGAGYQSRDALAKVLARGDVKVSIVGQDAHGRPVAKVTVGNVDVGSWMKQGGFATAWMGQPEGWPHGNELRGIRRDMPVEDKVRFADLEMWYRKFGLMARSGRRPTPDQIKGAEREAKYFMDKYINPQGKRVQQGGLDPESERAMGIIPTAPGASNQPLGRPVTAPDKWENIAGNVSRPQGKREWSAWERTLHPPELALWRKFQSTEQYYHTHAPNTNRAKYFADPEYVRFRKLYEKFLDKTTKRWRDMPPPSPTEGGRGGRRRRRRADLGEDVVEALDAVA